MYRIAHCGPSRGSPRAARAGLRCGAAAAPRPSAPSPPSPPGSQHDQDWIELFIRSEKILSADSEFWLIFRNLFHFFCNSQWIWMSPTPWVILIFLHWSVKFRHIFIKIQKKSSFNMKIVKIRINWIMNLIIFTKSVTTFFAGILRSERCRSMYIL